MTYADAKCTYEEVFDPHGYRFTGPCVHTGKPHAVFVPAAELFAYRRGALIQVAMPSVSADDREFLMSGYSPAGWAAAFGADDPTE